MTGVQTAEQKSQSLNKIWKFGVVGARGKIIFIRVEIVAWFDATNQWNTKIT